MSKLSIHLLPTAALAFSLFVAVPSFADSQARVVRLSDVQGDVQIDRNAGQGIEKAFLNLPITQGAKLHVGKDGRAGVEFEDGSTLRITPNTVIDFPQLLLRDSGTKVSAVHLQEGTAYVNFAGAKDDAFTLTFGHEKLALTQSAHLRVEMADAVATVAVFSGDAQVQSSSGTLDVSKNHTASFDLSDGDRSTLTRDLEPDPYDAWDKQQAQYHQQYAGNSYSSYSPYAYGTTDLNYYGNFSTVPGYGTMWQPYFAGAGWDPFMNGAWAFAPGFGYGWVSGYPWGWTPYHYGSWAYVPTYGWGWQPGGSWAGWSAPRVVHPPSNFVLPQAPANQGQRITMVNRGPMPLQLGKSSSHLRISNNSAGLGIPRGSIKNLDQLSRTVRQDGFADARIHTAPVGISPWYGGRSAAGQHAGGFHGGAPSVSAGRSEEHTS